MKKINLKTRFKNKVFLVSFSSTVILLLTQLGLGKYIPANLSDIINSLLVILSLLGVIVDPTTKGLGDTDYVMEGKNTDEIRHEYYEAIGRKLAKINGVEDKLDELGMRQHFDYASYGEQELRNEELNNDDNVEG